MGNYIEHNALIKSALSEKMWSITSLLRMGQASSSQKEREQVTRLMRGIVLNEEHLVFLSKIASETVAEFYEQLGEVKTLLSSSSSVDKRCQHAEDLITAFSKAMNIVLPDSIEFIPPIEADEVLYTAPRLRTFEEKKKTTNQTNRKEKDCGSILFGEFRQGLGLIFDRFSQFHSQSIGLNIDDDAIKATLPLIQLYAVAHEAGHAIEDYLSTRKEYAAFPILPFMQDAINHSRLTIDSDENFDAYKASPTEQYADFFGHIFLTAFINRLTEEHDLEPDIKKQISGILKNSLQTINKTLQRTNFTDDCIEAAREANLMQLTAS